ncbi:YihY/virulence factor BrkB family protein [Terrimonas sp. NA20]|uniref:YihY/virulence factor BrkB family protein n=1 Tax=Terrimonas ginsenosidimutans TaxID=2908004 RepID=A0ABS9KYV9_9BACT|nr:YihY/virulence factor BrkB family protein [Terrimonas ginsenosidimutans]MCG2617526.1 YihY/virulence factor BrkB family protein [Terrimonas ginsenosidimutans]
MKIITRFKRELITSEPASFLVRKSKKVILPGFQGIPLYDVIRFFMEQMKKTGFTERASAIAFNFTMAIPPAVIFLFTLIPYLPISKQFIFQMFSLIRDVVPGEKNNHGLITFLSDILNKPRTGLLSTGFILAMFFSSNAIMGIMRSFDKNYVGFKKRKGLHQRSMALRLTFILFILFFITIILLIMQGAVLRWLGITNETVISLIHNLRWLLIVAMFFFSISFIYRYAPAVHKRWRLINPGSILAAFLMIVFTAGFSYWVSNFSNYNELYGSISTVLILMLLIYFNSLVLLVGFELNVSINSLKYEVDERNKNLAGGNLPA